MKDKNATIIVDLKPSEDEIKKNLHKDARRGIKKSEKEGLEINFAKTDDEWKEFYEIYKETMSTGGADIESLDELKQKLDNLFLCKYKNKIIAGMGIGFGGDYKKEIPVMFINASLKGDYQKLRPNDALYWHCIKWCKEKGYDKFDLGGWQINARGHLKGVNKFKEKWGKIVYYKRDYPMHKAIGRKLIKKSDILWHVNKKLKGR